MVIPPSAWDTWVLGPLTAAAAAYHAAALVPSAWLPTPWRAHGYPSDVFLLLRQRTTISTQLLRDALAPGGALSGLAHAVLEGGRAAFAAMAHQNFSVLFPSENVTADEVTASLEALMKTDASLSKYVI